MLKNKRLQTRWSKNACGNGCAQMFKRIDITTLSKNDVLRIGQIMQEAHTYPWSKQALLECFVAGYDVVGGFYQQTLAGFYVCYRVLDESHLLNFCVAPRYQRRGIAKQLLAHYLLVEKNAGVRHFFLEVRQSNVPAQNLYTGAGFKVYSKRKAYYQSNAFCEDAVMMRLDDVSEVNFDD